jgi:hypothetical protein
MTKAISNIVCQTIWTEITDLFSGKMPDDEKHVLVYDGYEDDVIIGYAETKDNGGHNWINLQSQGIIKDPQWWAELPFPDGGHTATTTDKF